jgi:hypothetical protein
MQSIVGMAPEGSQRSTHPTGYGSKFDLFAPLAFCWWKYSWADDA